MWQIITMEMRTTHTAEASMQRQNQDSSKIPMQSFMYQWIDVVSFFMQLFTRFAVIPILHVMCHLYVIALYSCGLHSLDVTSLPQSAHEMS